MKIAAVRVHPVAVNRTYATLTSGGPGAKSGELPPGVSTSYYHIIELVSDEGLTGFGEVSDIDPGARLPSGELMTAPALQRALSEALVGLDPLQMERNTERPRFGRLVECAIDCACYDLAGKRHGLPVSGLAGGRYRDRIWISWVAYIRRPAEMEPEIVQKLEEGFTAFKLKVGRDIDLDEERVALFRKLGGERLHLKLDPNAAWDVDEAIQNIRRLEKYHPDGIETPTDPRNLEGMARIRRETGVKLIEHVSTLDYALKAVLAQAVDVFNISTVGAGGLYRAKKICAVAEAAGVDCLLGSTIEMGIGTAHQAHLAASSRVVTWPSDLVGPGLLVDDVLAQPHRYEQGYLRVPDGPGLGVTLDRGKLAALARDLPAQA